LLPGCPDYFHALVLYINPDAAQAETAQVCRAAGWYGKEKESAASIKVISNKKMLENGVAESRNLARQHIIG